MGRSVYCLSHSDGNCALSVQKNIYLHSPHSNNIKKQQTPLKYNAGRAFGLSVKNELLTYICKITFKCLSLAASG